ncbi:MULTISPECIES: TonB-dependent receptor [unclassified Duganella]|uniref:TonB-dependent receptor n=1 Tax=unclassified Duganella TaxID=2636909 RepID=UPI0006FD6DD3|nr:MULTISPECIES: TonB-dependent receptor [unclassified Duganella]KQV51192.1 TonB-dependent receptor [Duganella sp. Root336D2]KRC03020.1 TonB-dependent receptor [Duganella sp. Root198D2]
MDKRLKHSLIALAVASAFPLYSASAQEAQPTEEVKKPGQLETVIVTAQRRAENIKDVPMAIATLKGEKLDVLTSGGQDIRFLNGRSPSVSVESDYGRTFPRFYIRGLGNTDFDLNASQPVGLVMDDIVQENPMLKGFPVFDVDQVEVLRGPQGTLFGRNSPAGVIKFDSAKPVFRQEGYVNVGFGKDRVRNYEGAYNFPVNDVLATRISLQSQHRGDRVHNDRPGAPIRDFEGYKDNAGRIQFLLKPDKDFSALLNLHGRDMDGNATLFRANILKKGTNELVDNFDYKSYPTDGGNEQHLKNKGANLRLRWDTPGLTFHSITGYEKLEFYSRGDVDGGYGASFHPPSGPGTIPFPVETADLIPDHKQISQEFRVESNNKGPLQWIAGVFYFDEHIQIDSISFDSFTAGNPQNAAYSTQQQDAKSYAAFGTINYTVNEAFKLRAGLRYTKDKKDFIATRVEPPQSASNALSDTSSNVSWDLSGTYTLNKDTNLFGRIATGYRAPSMQGRLFDLTSLPSKADAEKALSVEFGVKQDLFDRRARMSATVFNYRMKDKQLTAGSGTVNMNRLINADKVTGRGIEVDLQANLSDAWAVTFGTSYNDTKIKDADLFVQSCGGGCTPTDPRVQFLDANGNVVGSAALINGNPLPRAPKWQHNFTLRFSQPLGDGEIYAYTDWAYRTSYNFFLYEAPEYKAKELLEGGLRVGYRWNDGKYELAAYGRNITNRIQALGAIDFNNLTGIVNEPRTYGVQFKANF